MSLPTPEQLDAEADRRYWLCHQDLSDDLDAMTPVVDVGDWRVIREQVLCDWTAAVFDGFFAAPATDPLETARMIPRRRRRVSRRMG